MMPIYTRLIPKVKQINSQNLADTTYCTQSIIPIPPMVSVTLAQSTTSPPKVDGGEFACKYGRLASLHFGPSSIKGTMMCDVVRSLQ